MHLYHVTPQANFESIYRLGISPQFALRDPKRVWFVTYEIIDWAINHVSERKQLERAELHIWRVRFDAQIAMRRCPMPGVFSSVHTIWPDPVPWTPRDGFHLPQF
jgi:hypothetical protein